MNYKVTRIGLLNFWYFDDEQFDFVDGKLLLRGENGSGKSVTMQSFIPLILDGNKAPNRLDPFGSKEKKIEDYLLGPSDGFQKEDSIGYLYMETYNANLDKYITIGMGLRARKGRGTDFWGFALKDGKRIGEDFFLYKDYGGKVLLTKNELRARLGNTNEFTETAKDYKSMVNRLLFGFKELDSYDEFINVLLQLRSSKLSKEYTPVKLMDILSSVLQPLTEDDLRPLSEAIEDTNKTKENIEKITNQVKVLSNFLKTYQNYNETLLYTKAKDASDRKKLIDTKKASIKEKEKELVNLSLDLDKTKEKLVELEKEYSANSARLDNIDDKDLKKHTENLNKIKIQIKDTEEKINTLKDKIDSLSDREKDITKRISDLDNKIFITEKEIDKIMKDASSLSEEVNFNELNPSIATTTEKNQLNFDYLLERINKYKAKLNAIKVKLEEKETLEQYMNEKQESHLKLKKQYDDKEKEEKAKEKLILEKIDDFKDEVNKLNSENIILKLDEDSRIKIISLINDYSYTNYSTARDIYQNIGNYYREKILEEKNSITIKITNEKEKLSVLNEELKLLKDQDALEFIAPESEIETTNQLRTLNIPYIPLYKAIEFKDTIEESDKNRIEELLLKLNILNANIIPKKDYNLLDNLQGIFLKAGTKKRNNLLSYVDVVKNDFIKETEIMDILSSISIDPNEENYISPKKYQLDFIVGLSGDKYESKYIGLLKRVELQKLKIKEKEAEILEEETLINNYNNTLTDIRKKLSIIETELKIFPTNSELESIQGEINTLVASLTIIDENIRNIVEEITLLSKRIESKIQEINLIKENINIPLNLASYKKSLTIIDDIISKLYNLKSASDSLANLKDRKISNEVEKGEIVSNISYQQEELSTKELSLYKLLSEKKTIDDILANPDYQKLLAEVKKLTERQNKIPNEQMALSEKKGSLESSYNTTKNEIEISKKTLEMDNLILKIKTNILEEEYNLGYVYNAEKVEAEEILVDLKERKNSDPTSALKNYLESFNEYRTELLEYRISTKEIFYPNDVIIAQYVNKGLSQEEAEQLLKSGIRQDITTIYQGKILNAFELLDYLNEAIEESENYISTQERHLFEDILLKTVGNKIRDRIESSKEWVKQINDIMQRTQIDSNLSFKLEWKSKTSYQEDELDTKELIRLFKIEAGMIDKKDSDKLIMHFRSQIKKELEYSEKSHESYASIISRVLDYRNWFEFRLFYRRKASDWKELSNKVFFILSGGERAKSMYVPLFAAVYAKLMTAEDKALRLIALDEAFAGVDNSNIREMFDILSQLNLDYILTSQSLWGDYDTVPALSMCELIKDEANRAVGVRHYRWNGHSKELLED